MHLRIGPVEAASARSWVANARTVLEGVRRAGDRVPVDLPADVDTAFDVLVEAWAEVADAAGDGDFLWEAEMDTDQVRHLVVYWFTLLTLDDETWTSLGLPFAPPEAEAFYLALSSSVTEALAAEDEEVGATLKASWPEDTSIPPRPPVDRPRRVVVIDDTEDVRLLLSMTLGVDGRFEVVGEARDGAEGLDVCRRTQPDAVILDVMMPGTDGLTALPQIRRECPHARIVMLSADDRPAVVEEAMQGGADAFVTKGADIDRTIDALL